MNNIILIGMPASGKSTAGVILAKVMGKGFIDTDLVIQAREDMLLSCIISERGVDAFLECEEAALMSVNVSDTVIATGGSAVYSERAMKHLSEGGTVVYLKVPKARLLDRLRDIQGRGVVMHDGETIDSIYDTRSVLYERYADIIIDEEGLSIEQTVREIVQKTDHERNI